MNFKHVLLYFSLFIFLIFGCKKDKIESFDVPPAIDVQTALQQLGTQKEKDFFDWNFLIDTNPYILPRLKERNGEDSLLQAVYEYMLLLNLENYYVSDLIDNYGYPAWDQSDFVPDTNNLDYKTVVTPYARLNEDFTSGYTIALPHEWGYEEGFYILMFDRAIVDSLVSISSSLDDPAGLAFHVATFMYFDELLFGTVDQDFKAYLLNLPPDGFGTGGEASVSERSIYRTLCNAGPLEQIGRVYYTQIYVPCGGLFDNGSNTIGTVVNLGNTGAGSNNGSTSTSAQVTQIIQICEQYAAANEPGGIPPSEIQGYNPETECKCEQFTAIHENLTLSSSDLLCLYSRANCDDSDKDAAQMISEYVNNSEIDPDLVAAYLKQSNCGTEGMGFKQFQILYKKVYDKLVPTLGLNANVDGPFLMDHPVLAQQIDELISDHPNDQLAIDYATNAFHEISTNSFIWTEEYITNLFEGYDELSNYLESSTEQVTEIQNGITIMEIYLSPNQQLPSSATALGGSGPNPIGGPDLISHTNRDYGFLDVIAQTDVHAPELIQEGIMKILLYAATGNNYMQSVASSYMNEFKNNPTDGSNYYHQALSYYVMEATKMRNWLKLYGDELNDELIANNGNINNVSPPNIQRPIMNENSGLGILINDTQQAFMYLLDSWEFDPATGEWNGRFMVNVTDHFGLDDDDAKDYQYVPGFVAWWALQHRRDWHPFVTDIWFVARLSGKI